MPSAAELARAYRYPRRYAAQAKPHWYEIGFDETKHPRKGKGDPAGGQFAPGNAGGSGESSAGRFVLTPLEERVAQVQFGEHTPDREKKFFRDIEYRQKELNGAIIEHAKVIPGAGARGLLEMTPAEAAKAARAVRAAGVTSGLSGTIASLKVAAEQAADRVALTRWAESLGGKRKTIRLYRGVSGIYDPKREGGEISSWTSDRSVAERFSMRGRKGTLLAADVPISALLLSPKSSSWLARYGEYEYLVLKQLVRPQVVRQHTATFGEGFFQSMNDSTASSLQSALAFFLALGFPTPQALVAALGLASNGDSKNRIGDNKESRQ